MRYFPIVFFLLSAAQPLFSQSLRAYERAGDQAFERKDWGTAISHYRTVLQRDDDNNSVRWKLAETARLYQSYLEADRSYAHLAEDKHSSHSYPLALYQLAEVKKMLGNYADAIALFQQFLSEKHNVPADYLQKAREQISACQNAQRLAAGANKDVVIRHPGKEVNSLYSDFAPMIAGDTLFFSSYRFDRRTPIGKTKSKITRVLMSVKGSRAREVGRGFPTTDTAHVAHTALTPDGHYLFFTLCKNLNASDIRCELWVTVLDRRSRWLPPQRLPESVNLPGYTATQPSVGFDSLTHSPLLWFASDRPGGKGKLDLWSVPLDTNFFCPCNLPLPGNKMGRLPKFATPTNVADLNTPENDGTPYFHSPQQTLYFSSEGWPGMGGYDIFSSRKTALSYTSPQNAGAGLNTSYNDLYFVLRPDGRSGYLSSNRPGSFYLDEANKACCNDLFEFILPAPQAPELLKPVPSDSLPLLAAKV
ncbi:MAG TPA: tetratricopeptide repeat protein, partial [Saprospiraceae bacterium]|nr:tetratricopeptide repeat protein [Saprospiraceae bacterium]